MKEQAQLREEMAYQYKLGNFEVRTTNLICFCNLIIWLWLIVDAKPTFIYRLQLLFKEDWTQILPCEFIGSIVGLKLLQFAFFTLYKMHMDPHCHTASQDITAGDELPKKTTFHCTVFKSNGSMWCSRLNHFVTLIYVLPQFSLIDGSLLLLLF